LLTDVQDGGNNCGIVRFKRKLQLVVNGTEKQATHHFYFFPQRKRPVFPKDSNAWTEIYSKSSQLKLAPRSKQARRIVTVTATTRDSDDSVTFLPPPPSRKRRHHITTTPFDIFNDTKTKTLFNVANRGEFVDRVTRMQTALQQHKVSLFLSMPHEKKE
jgi:hypothetical protein